MKKSDVVRSVLNTMQIVQGEPVSARESMEQLSSSKSNAKQQKGLAFAPTNIALCKYWGKRNSELNLPVTSSLSIALPDKGAMTTLTFNEKAEDKIILNDRELPADIPFTKRVTEFLDLFRERNEWWLQIDIKMNLPVAAGLASSACGFASLTAALNDLFNWKLSTRGLSILARLGSGSASRSFWQGFVEWHAGVQPDGMDSYAEPLSYEWANLKVGLLILEDKEKSISSRLAMQRTVDTSVLYSSWPKKVARDLVTIRQAIHTKSFSLLGGAAESNALSMHATMMGCWPPICYTQPETLAIMQRVWKLRDEGLEIFFTQDAGPNLKLLFLETDQHHVRKNFEDLEIVKLFD